MAAIQLGRVLSVAMGAVLLVVVIMSSGLLSESASMVLDDSAQLVTGSSAAVLCYWTARRLRGPERRWRLFMAAGMGGWTIGMGFWAWYRNFSDTPLPSPSPADIGFFTLPLFALPALLMLAVDPPRYETARPRYASAVSFLDSLVVVGSLFIIAWAAVLGSVVRAGAPTAAEFLVAIGYPVTGLVLVVLILLLAVNRRVPTQYHPQLWLLGSGLVMLVLSDSIFAYLVSSGAEEMPLVTDAGFIAGPALIAIASLVTSEDEPADWPAAQATVERAHLLLPYVLVGITGSVVIAQIVFGPGPDMVEVTVAWIVVVLVLIRQVMTIIENMRLLEQVSATRAELAYRAEHDPLTGLANRSLFNDRLTSAVDRHRDRGQGFALLIVDLDDFKSINDTLGHATGDRLLRVVGERLRRCVRESDTVARLGGDEFAVVLDSQSDSPHVAGERIVSSLREPYVVDGHILSVGASVGVVEPGGDDIDLTPDGVLRRADGAMYAGKRRGKGHVVRYDPELLG